MLIKSRAVISLSNNTTITVEQAQPGVLSNNTNTISSIQITETLSEDSEHPIGNVSYSSLTLKIISPDKSLLPENTNSTYYGFMDSSAIVNVTIYDDNNVGILFGTYYVDRWYGTISSDDSKEITIVGNNPLYSLINTPMPSMELKRNYEVSNYVRELIGKKNTTLDNRYQINISNSLNFGAFSSMQFTDIEADTIGDALDELSKSTLTYIYIDRDNVLKTDYAMDDTIPVNPYTIGDCINIRTVKSGQGCLSDYSGVELSYNNYTVTPITELANITQTLSSGTNILDSISANGRIYKLTNIDVNCEDNTGVVISNLSYDKDKVDLTLVNNTGGELDSDITIFGQKITDNIQKVEQYISGRNGDALQVTNNIIWKSMVDSYVYRILKLIEQRRTIIYAYGYFDPKMKIGDVVLLDTSQTINVNGYYKIISLDWEFKTDVICTARMIKYVSL